MFVRSHKKRGKGGKIVRYYELVETIWRNNKPTTRFIAYLGKKIPSEAKLKELYGLKLGENKKGALQGFKGSLDVFKQYNSKESLDDEELLQARIDMEKELLSNLHFKPYRSGFIDPGGQALINLKTGTVRSRLTGRYARVLVGDVVYTTAVLKKRLFKLHKESDAKTLAKLSKHLPSQSLEDFRKLTGT